MTLDALLSSLLAIAFAGFVVAQQPSATARARRNAMWLAWAAVAGATAHGFDTFRRHRSRCAASFVALWAARAELEKRHEVRSLKECCE